MELPGSSGGRMQTRPPPGDLVARVTSQPICWTRVFIEIAGSSLASFSCTGVAWRDGSFVRTASVPSLW